MVPKIRDADKKDITTLSKELKNISKLSAELKIDKREFFGGSITISSLREHRRKFFYTNNKPARSCYTWCRKS